MVLSLFLSTKTNGKKGKSQGYLGSTVAVVVFQSIFTLKNMLIIFFLFFKNYF
jgi:hypothetical protein